MKAPMVSIIVPTLNEAAGVVPFLHHLRRAAPDAEIIVVDGGSHDGTSDLAKGRCDAVLRSDPGRASQMNAGAKVSRGDVLWFIHADTGLSERCLEEVVKSLEHHETVGGFFRIRFPKREWVFRINDTVAHYAGLLFRIRCGDHAFFCRRQTFDEIGGYPQVPLMEDVEFHRLLLRHGKVAALPVRITTSARRFEQLGACRITAAYTLIMTLYVAGISPARLAAIYGKLCVRHPHGHATQPKLCLD